MVYHGRTFVQNFVKIGYFRSRYKGHRLYGDSYVPKKHFPYIRQSKPEKWWQIMAKKGTFILVVSAQLLVPKLKTNFSLSVMTIWKSLHPSVSITVDQMTLGGGLISSSCVSINEKTLLIYVLTQNIRLKAPDNKCLRLQQFNFEDTFDLSRLVEHLNHGVIIRTG